LTRRLDISSDFETYIVPAIKPLGNLLHCKCIDADMKEKLEGITQVYFNICNAILRTHDDHPSNISFFQKSFELIAPTELISNLLNILTIASTTKISIISPNTWNNIIFSLRNICNYCPEVSLQCISGGLLHVIQKLLNEKQILTGMEKSQESAILLIDAILPQKYLMEASKKDRELNKIRIEIELKKEQIVLSQTDAIQILCENVLVKLIEIFEETMNLNMKLSCIHSIEKLCKLCNLDAIAKTINPIIAARLVIQNLNMNDNVFVAMGLSFLELVLQKLAEINGDYLIQARREGIFEKLMQFNDLPELLKRFDEDRNRQNLREDNGYIKYLVSQGLTLYKKYKKKHKNDTYEEENKNFAFEKLNSEMSRCHYLLGRKLWGEIMLFQYINYYVFLKSEQICENFINNSDYLEKFPILKESETLLLKCENIAKSIDILLLKGCSNEQKEWENIFTELAKILSKNQGLTKYETKRSKIIRKLYESLCMLPHDFLRNANENPMEDIKEQNFNFDNYAEIKEISMRHNEFMKSFRKNPEGIRQLINQAVELCNEIDLFSGEQKNERKIDKPNEEIVKCLRDGMMKINLIYQPSKNLVQNIEKCENEELLNLHKKYSSKSSFKITTDRNSTFKKLEKWLLSNIKPGQSFIPIRERYSEFSEFDRFLLRGSHLEEEFKNEESENLMKLNPESDENSALDIIDILENPISSEPAKIPINLPPNPFLQKPIDLPREIKPPQKLQLPKNLDFSKKSDSPKKPDSPTIPNFTRIADLIKIQETSQKSQKSDSPKDSEKISKPDIFMRKDSENSKENKPNPNKNYKLKINFNCCDQEITNKHISIFEWVLRKNPSEINFTFTIFEKSNQDYLITNLSNFPADCQETIILLSNLKSRPIFTDQSINSVECLNFLKFAYHKISRENLQTEISREKIPTLLCTLKEQDFIVQKIEQRIKKEIMEKTIYGGRSPSEHRKILKAICYSYPFILTQKTRMTYFKSLNPRKRLAGNRISLDEIMDIERNRRTRIKVKIDRKFIIEDGFKAMENHGFTSATLEFDFAEEKGSGIGPTLEFYELTAAELNNISYLWRKNKQNETLFPAPIDPHNRNPLHDHEKLFKYLGWLIGRAIIDDRLLDLPLSETFWDLVMGNKLGTSDIQKIDQNVGNFLIELEDYIKRKNIINSDNSLSNSEKLQKISELIISENCKISDLFLNFVMPGYENIELKPSGANIFLNEENVQEYINLICENYFKKTVELQINAFKQGFSMVFNIDLLKCFQSKELEELVCGQKAKLWEKSELIQNIDAAQGYSKDSLQYGYVIQYLSSLDQETQKSFLKYVTGSSRLPFGGFARLDPLLTIAKRITPEGDCPDLYFPSVMTCQKNLKVPEYSSYEILANKFNYALKEGQNEFTMS